MLEKKRNRTTSKRLPATFDTENLPGVEEDFSHVARVVDGSPGPKSLGLLIVVDRPFYPRASLYYPRPRCRLSRSWFILTIPPLHPLEDNRFFEYMNLQRAKLVLMRVPEVCVTTTKGK
jgi:hypothetical protein